MPKKDPDNIAPEPKPDNRAVKKDGGFLFKAWGIHVAAKSVEDAKKLIKEAYGVDVDKQTPPSPTPSEPSESTE